MVSKAGEAREDASAKDGRVLRGARNHAAIVEAVYELVKATHLPPSVEDVARRAGVGTRTVFRQFQDLETLHRSINERVQEEVLSLIAVTAPTGHLKDDLRALVARRARLFEYLTPFRRAARLVRHQSPFLQEQDATATKLLRGMVEWVVGPHFGDDGRNTLEALDALLSFEAWDRLRAQQQLSAKRAERVLLESVITLAKAAGRAKG